MQDWITDNHKRITIFLGSLSLALGACAAAQTRDYVDATAWSANYTEDNIREFHLETISGKNLLLSGNQVKQFSMGGTGASECCSPIPGVGRTIRVVWKIGGYNDDEGRLKTYSRDVVMTGTMPIKEDSYNVVIVRFFKNHAVEAELIPDRGVTGLPHHRVDKLFYGQRVMREVGE